MTVNELMAHAKAICDNAKLARLDSETTLDELDCENIECLSIAHSYEGEIPDVRIFPQLKSLFITRVLSLAEFEKMNLSTIESLKISLKKNISEIHINAPKVKKLSIYIDKNDNNQLTLFDVNTIIDISGCDLLEELELRHFTDCTIKANTLHDLKKFICFDYKRYDFEILKFMPNLTYLNVVDCGLEKIDFLSFAPNIVELDLSYNEIKDASEVLELKNLKELHLKQNPLDNVECYRVLPYEVFIDEEDYAFSRFKGEVDRCTTVAYYELRSARAPRSKRLQWLQKYYSTKTDEQIFLNKLIACLEKCIEDFSTPSKTHFKTVFGKQELVEYVVDKYPFLAKYFELETK